MILVLWVSLFDMADINNTEGDTTLQECLSLTITYSASVDDVVSRQKEIMEAEGEVAAPVWFTNNDFKDLLQKLKKVSFL